MADEAVVAPATGSLSKLARKFEELADDADWVVIKLSDLKVTPGSVSWAPEFKQRFDSRKTTYQTQIENLQMDFRDIAAQLRLVEASYENTEIDNKDDIERLRDMINKLMPRNPGIESTMPQGSA